MNSGTLFEKIGLLEPVHVLRDFFSINDVQHQIETSVLGKVAWEWNQEVDELTALDATLSRHCCLWGKT